MVSSNWDDSFGSQHLPSAIYALAETARGENAAFLHICSKFTVRALGVRSPCRSRLIALHLSLMVELFVADIENLCSQITKFSTTYALVLCMTVYAYCTLYKFMRDRLLRGGNPPVELSHTRQRCLC